MLGKLLEWCINRYYRKDVKSRSVMLIQGGQNGILVKMRGTKKKNKRDLYVAMKRSKDIRDIVLEASELYRVTDGYPYMKKFSELSKEDNDN